MTVFTGKSPIRLGQARLKSETESIKAAIASDNCEFPMIGAQFGVGGIQFGAGIGTVQKIKAAMNAI
jgi:hypothetical protein